MRNVSRRRREQAMCLQWRHVFGYVFVAIVALTLLDALFGEWVYGSLSIRSS